MFIDSNSDRADAAKLAVDAFVAEMYHGQHGETAETILADLVADLFHLMDREGISPLSVIRRAIDHHREEVWEELAYREVAGA